MEVYWRVLADEISHVLRCFSTEVRERCAERGMLTVLAVTSRLFHETTEVL